MDNPIEARTISDQSDLTAGVEIGLPGSCARNRTKVLVAMFFATIFIAFGDISLSKGMKIVGGMSLHSLPQLVAAIANVYVIAGVLLQMAFLGLYLAALSWEDLSFVLPLTAFNYVVVTLLAFAVLHEDVSPQRWLGSLLVATGIAFVTRT